MPSLLLQHLEREGGKKDRVEIHVDQIVKVLQILAGHRITGPIRIGEGVEKGIERPLEQLDERLLHRVFAGAAQHGVLHDMGHARRIGHRRAEIDAEHLVLVFIDQRQQFGTGAMSIKKSARVELADLPFSDQFEVPFRHLILFSNSSHIERKKHSSKIP